MKYNDNGTYKDIYIKALDTLPVGTEVDFDGNSVPSGWTSTNDDNITITYSLAGKSVSANGSVELGTIPSNNGKAYIGNYAKDGVSISGVFCIIVSKANDKIYLNCVNAQTFGPTAEITITYMYEIPKIKKTSQYIEGGASLSNVYGTSQSNGYSQEYINGIVESGGTADNYYVKYADGTMICTQKYNTNVNFSTAYGGMYRCTAISGLPNFANTFNAVPNISIKMDTIGYVMCAESTASNVNKIYGAVGSSGTQSVTFDIIAIGRWKALDTTQNTRSISNDEVEEPIEEDNNK